MRCARTSLATGLLRVESKLVKMVTAFRQSTRIVDDPRQNPSFPLGQAELGSGSAVQMSAPVAEQGSASSTLAFLPGRRAVAHSSTHVSLLHERVCAPNEKLREEIDAYFSVCAINVASCFGIGTCDAKHGIPPALCIRLGVCMCRLCWQ